MNMLRNGRTADVTKLVVPDWAKQKVFDQRIWDHWCRLFKEIIYWGA